MIEPRLRFKADDGSDFPDWEEKTLGELGTFTKGAALSKADISDEGNPLILYGELYTTYKEVAYEVKRKTQAIVDKIYYSNVGDVLIPTSGESAEEISTATCVMVPNVILAGDLNIFRSTVIDGRIMSYILNYQAKRKIATIAQGKSIVHIQAKQLGKIFVEYPVDKDEQQKIADFLSTIDTIIEKQRATVSAWEERKKGVMQKLFSQEVRFKADDGSDFPDWEEKKVASLGDMVGGGTPTTKKKEYWHGRTAWISSADVEENDIYNINMTRFITQEAIDNSATKIIPKNSILIVSRVGVGKVAKAPCDLCTSQDFTNIVDVKGDSTFLTYAVLRLMQSKLQCVQGTSIKGIPSDEIRNYIMNVPSLPEQQKIADCLSALDTVIQKQKETLEKWQELKKGLLQQMFV